MEWLGPPLPLVAESRLGGVGEEEPDELPAVALDHVLQVDTLDRGRHALEQHRAVVVARERRACTTRQGDAMDKPGVSENSDFLGVEREGYQMMKCRTFYPRCPRVGRVPAAQPSTRQLSFHGLESLTTASTSLI